MTFFGCNIYLLASTGVSIDGGKAGWFGAADLWDFASSINYSLNIGAVYFFNRNLMSSDVDLNSLTGQGLSSVALMYLLISMTSQRAFSASDSASLDSFSLYAKDIPVLKYSIYAYLPVAVTNCLIATLVATELLESLKWIKKLVRDPETGTVQIGKLKFLRMCMWALSVAVTSLFDNVLTVISAAGSLFTPLVGFIVPLVYFYTYHISRGTNHLSAKRILLDAMLVVVTIYFMYLGFRNVLSGKFED